MECRDLCICCTRWINFSILDDALFLPHLRFYKSVFKEFVHDEFVVWLVDFYGVWCLSVLHSNDEFIVGMNDLLDGLLSLAPS